MNQKQIILAASILCATLIGCESTEINRAENEFFYPVSFSVDTSYFHYGREIELRFSSYSNFYAPKYGGTNKERFKQYVYYFSDFGFRENEVWGFGCYDDDVEPYRPTSACVCDIKSIHIVTDDDFDTEHPAGANADDLFTISLESAYPYIKSDYKGYYSHYDNEFQLNNIDPDYLRLNGMWFGFLRLKKKPANEGLYSFTISIEMGDDPISGNNPNLEPQSFKLKF